MIVLLFANVLVRKLDPSDIWYLAAIELLLDAVVVSVLFGIVFL